MRSTREYTPPSQNAVILLPALSKMLALHILEQFTQIPVQLPNSSQKNPIRQSLVHMQASKHPREKVTKKKKRRQTPTHLFLTTYHRGKCCEH